MSKKSITILGTPSKKNEKFRDFVLNSKKFRTIWSAFGPPPSFMKLGLNCEKIRGSRLDGCSL